MILKFLTGSDTFNNRLFRVSHAGIKFDVQFFFHRPDDQEAHPTGKNDTVGSYTDQYFWPIRDLRQYFIENQYQFFRTAFKQAIQTDPRAIMPVFRPGQFSITILTCPAHYSKTT